MSGSARLRSQKARDLDDARRIKGNAELSVGRRGASIEVNTSKPDKPAKASAEIEPEEKKKKLKVPVPKGSKPGDTVLLIVRGRRCTAKVPDGLREGEVFKIREPDFQEPDEEDNKMRVKVDVPEGVGPGDMLGFNVGIKRCTVLVPKSKKAGDTFYVTLPKRLNQMNLDDKVKSAQARAYRS